MIGLGEGEEYERRPDFERTYNTGEPKEARIVSNRHGYFLELDFDFETALELAHRKDIDHHYVRRSLLERGASHDEAVSIVT